MRCENCKTFISLDDAILTISYGICRKLGRAVLKSSTDCAIEDWHERYKKELIEVAGIPQTEAEDCLMAGMGKFDYDDNPEDSADDEMSYWEADDEIDE